MRNNILKKAISLFLLLQCSVSYGQISPSTNQNYILTRTPMTNTTNANNLNTNSCLYTVQYFDKYGRLEETVSRKRSSQSRDLVNYIQYNQDGRIWQKWLPLPVIESNNGAHVHFDRLEDDARNYFNDADPCVSYEYERSVFGRIVREADPAEDWRLYGDFRTTNYARNLNDGGTFSCPRINATYSNDTLITLTRGTDYVSGELYVTVKKDEDDKTTHEFKDKLGQIVLTRQLGNSNHDTYYVYDNFGNIAAVLPPIITDMLTSGGSYNNSNEVIWKYAYLYCYDKRGNCIGKKLPGAAWTLYVYDHGSRLILTQDGNLRKQGKWLFTLPDKLGRNAVIGLYNASHNPFATDLANKDIYAEWKGSSAISSAFYGYQPQGIALTDPIVENVNFYDGYTFKAYNNLSNNYDFESQNSYGVQYTGGYQGMLTGSMKRTTSGKDMFTVFYYDDRGNIVQSKENNPLEGKEENFYEYDFRNKVTKRKHIHIAGSKNITEVYGYNYDHGERLITTTYQLTIDKIILPQITLSSKEYDEMNRVSRNKLHGLTSLAVDYTYNLRSYTTSISGCGFTQNLHYIDGPGVPYYNGNISSMTWKGPDNVTRGYKFSYDGLNRMTDGIYGEGNSINANLNRFTEQITEYDKNGNIKKLKRYGQTGANAYGLVDNLTLELKGNQLKTVSDAATATAYNNGFEFKKGANATIEYDYDPNGNLTKDLNKDIKEIQYNFLNLPNLVKFLDESTITYTYGADGTKLRTVHKIGSVTTTTDYCGNVIYENNTAKLLLTEEGYVSLNDNKYHYYLKDHQGNNRVVVDQNGNVEETNHYYPFGGVFANTGNAQPYKYNGKELDAKKGLNWYDYGARHYDAALGRWHAVDPLAEKYYSTSPYTYCLGKPQNAIDYQGKLVIFINGFTTNKQEQASVEYWSKSFVGQLTNQLKDNHVLYRHGGNSFDWRFRKFVGELQGLIDAPNLIKYISDKEGNIIETIKVITHSMGTAYGKGYVEAILKYFKEKGYTNALVTLEADFDPFQAGSLSIIPNVYTQQFTHNKMFGGDYWYIANQKQKGLENYYNDKQQGSHAITSFFNDISKLKEGTYIWNGSTWILEE